MLTNKNIILVSKDAQLAKNYPPFKDSYYSLPNIEELAKKGTVFCKHYTTAPSTAMAFTSMFTGKYNFETNRKKYVEVEENGEKTLFDEMNDYGYDTHIIWDQSYINLALKYSKCYGKNTIIHNTDFLTHPQKKHVKGKHDDLTYHKDLEEDCKVKFKALLGDILSTDKKVFVWVHFPHVLSGRNSYGSDLDLFDEMIGIIRSFFDDDAIFITADHGHMNGFNGKFGYGFDLHNSAIRIPLITPRISDVDFVDYNTSNIDLREIIVKSQIPKRDYLVSETAYYMQPHRKIAVIKGKYKYIYDKLTKKESLFDVDWDPEEKFNLLLTEIYDVDRRGKYSADQRFFYPFWKDSFSIIDELRDIKKSIWKKGPWYVELKERIIFRIKMIYQNIVNKFGK